MILFIQILLTLFGLALLVISFYGLWYRKEIEEGVKEFNRFRNENKRNPTSLELDLLIEEVKSRKRR